MKKKATTRKSPLPMASPPSPTRPKSTVLNSNKKKKPNVSGAAEGGLRSPPPPSHNKSLASISDLKELSSSRFDDVKCHLIDRSHSEIIKDLEASHSRLHKRFKIQTQTCQQLMDETEKDFKKMTERITERTEATKESYSELMAEAQATASRMCKTTIPAISKSFEKSIDALRSQFGVPST